MGGAAAALGAIELETSAQRIEATMRSDPAQPVDERELRAELETLRQRLDSLVRQLRTTLQAMPASPPRPGRRG
jgi:HPt (histidine-containing phosphotransfer) domain-containing protein